MGFGRSEVCCSSGRECAQSDPEYALLQHTASLHAETYVQRQHHITDIRRVIPRGVAKNLLRGRDKPGGLGDGSPQRGPGAGIWKT